MAISAFATARRAEGVSARFISFSEELDEQSRRRIRSIRSGAGELHNLRPFSVSSAMSLPKSVGESGSVVAPRSASRALILGSARAAVHPSHLPEKRTSGHRRAAPRPSVGLPPGGVRSRKGCGKSKRGLLSLSASQNPNLGSCSTLQMRGNARFLELSNGRHCPPFAAEVSHRNPVVVARRSDLVRYGHRGAANSPSAQD